MTDRPLSFLSANPNQSTKAGHESYYSRTIHAGAHAWAGRRGQPSKSNQIKSQVYVVTLQAMPLTSLRGENKETQAKVQFKYEQIRCLCICLSKNKLNIMFGDGQKSGEKIITPEMEENCQS